MTCPLPSPALIAAMAPLRPVPGCRSILIHQADDPFGLWQAWEAECGQECPIPFWALAWPAARVLSRYVLEHPAVVSGRKVLDLGAGCGIVAIAALQAGARLAVASDIDRAALCMSSLNAEANRVALLTAAGDLTLARSSIREMDVILAADLFYQQEEARATGAFCSRARREGKTVLIADSGRPFAPDRGVTLVAERTVAVDFEVEGVRERRVRILRVTGDL